MNAALFGSAIGTCGVGWTTRGVCRVQLPAGDDSATRHLMASRAPQMGALVWRAPPAEVEAIVARLQRHLAGKLDPLHEGICLDLRATTPFAQTIYHALRETVPGQSLSYGELGARSGHPGAARAVGQAMANNPVPLLVPCHRVVAANATLGHFSAPGGSATKLQLLTIEGAELRLNRRAGRRRAI